MAVEGGISHMWTVSMIQTHPSACVVVDEDATAELKVKTVRYFKGLERVMNGLRDDGIDVPPLVSPAPARKPSYGGGSKH